MMPYKLEPSECADYTTEDNIEALDRYNAQEEAERDPVYWITSAGSLLSNIQQGYPGSISEVQDMLTKALKLMEK